MSPRNQIICAAMKEGRVLEFFYENGLRRIEPYLLGYTKYSKMMVLVGYQIGGFSESKQYPPWRKFNVNRIRNLLITDVVINKARATPESDWDVVNTICSKFEQ